MASNKKQRFCPVLDRDIKRGECGQWRNQTVECSLDCIHNPLALSNHHRLVELEIRTIEAAMDRIRTRANPDRRLQLERLWRTRGDGLEIAQQQNLAFFHDRDATGHTFGENWLHDKRHKWRNDQKVIWEAHMGSRLRLLEIRCIRDDICVEAIDLLEPNGKRLLILDEELAANSVRFCQILARTCEFPHYHRIMDLYNQLPFVGLMTGGRLFLHLVERLQAKQPAQVEFPFEFGLTSTPEGDRWLLEKILQLLDQVDRVATCYRDAVRRQLYSDVWEATYRETDDCLDIMRRIQEDPRFFSTEESDNSVEIDPGGAYLFHGKSGSASLAQDPFLKEWLVMTQNRATMDEVYALLREFSANSIIQEKMIRKPGDEKPVRLKRADLPKNLLSNLESVSWNSVHMSEFGDSDADAQRLFKEWLERPNPALRNHRPIDKVDPKLHEVRMDLVKMQIQYLDDHALEFRGSCPSVNDLLSLAGLDSLLEAASPLRSPLSPDSGMSDTSMEMAPPVAPGACLNQHDQEQAEICERIWEQRPLSPFLRKPHSLRTVNLRLQRREGQFGNFTDLETAMHEIAVTSGYSFLIEMVECCCEVGLTSDEACEFLLSAAIVFAALVNQGAKIRHPRPGRLLSNYNDRCHRIPLNSIPEPDIQTFPYTHLLSDTTHPLVFGKAAFHFQERMKSLRPEPTNEAIVTGQYLLSSVVETVDQFLGFKRG